MSWIATAVGVGVGGLLNYSKNQQDQKNQRAQMNANAAQIQYSPWTHANVQMQGPTVGNSTNAVLGGALQGGLAGAAFGSQFKGTNAAPAASTSQATIGSPLGGQAMSNQLGQRAQAFGQNDWAQLQYPKQTFYAGR